jgi:autotransporter-associated beta strand protein
LGATGANNGTTVSSGAALNLDGTGGVLSIGAELLTLNGTGVTAAPAGALQNIAGTNSYAGGITLGSASTITSAAGTLTLTGGITNGGNFLTMDGAGDTTVSTTKITGSGGLTKNGAGTLTLSVASDYTGSTSVSAGTLLVTNTTGSATGTNSVTVSNLGTTLSGGTTSGAGGISGAVNINPDAKLSPGTSGNGAGTTAILHTGALTLVGASNYAVDLNGTTAGSGHDQVISSGPIVLTGANLLVTVGGSLSLLDKFFILDNSGATTNTGTFAQGATVTANNGWTFAINYLDSDPADGTPLNDISLTLTAIPEPSTWISGALVLGLVGWSVLKSGTRHGVARPRRRRELKRGKADSSELVRRAA